MFTIQTLKGFKFQTARCLVVTLQRWQRAQDKHTQHTETCQQFTPQSTEIALTHRTVRFYVNSLSQYGHPLIPPLPASPIGTRRRVACKEKKIFNSGFLSYIHTSKLTLFIWKLLYFLICYAFMGKSLKFGMAIVSPCRRT